MWNEPISPGAQQEIDRRPDANSSRAPTARTSAAHFPDRDAYNATFMDRITDASAEVYSFDMDRFPDASDQTRPLLPASQRRGPERKPSAPSSMQTRPDPSTLHQTSGQLLHLFCADLDLAAAMPFFADRFTDASEDACSLLAVRQETDRFPDVTFPPLCIALDVEQYYVWRNVPPVLCRSPRPFSVAVSRYQREKVVYWYSYSNHYVRRRLCLVAK